MVIYVQVKLIFCRNPNGLSARRFGVGEKNDAYNRQNQVYLDEYVYL